MLHCTYYNPNRVMTRGYLHAVEVTFLSVELLCVLRSRQLSDVDITGGHGKGCHNEWHELAIPTIISHFLRLDTPLITQHILYFNICGTRTWSLPSYFSDNIESQFLPFIISPVSKDFKKNKLFSQLEKTVGVSPSPSVFQFIFWVLFTQYHLPKFTQ